MPDPNLRSPYVQQWNISIEHDFKGFLLDVRYVGNHGTKLLRALDFNQIDINAGGFLADFQRAQSNGYHRAGGDRRIRPGVQREPGGQPAADRVPDAAQRRQPDQRHQPHHHPAGRGGRPGVHLPIHQGERADQLLPEPERGQPAHDDQLFQLHLQRLQVDVRTRERRGLTLFGNYTYSKVLSDAVSGVDNNNQGRYEPMIDNNNPGWSARARRSI